MPAPEHVVLEGRYALLEPLATRHAADLYAATRDHPALFTYLGEEAPAEQADVGSWLERTLTRSDLLMWAVVDRRTGRAEGRQALLRVDPGNGVVEFGSILWGPGIARSRVATEAFALHAAYVFDTLGYRRLEWKCDERNAASRRAAGRFGFTFEGRFAQHMVVKGRNRDTTWFALLDRDWPAQRERLADWLDPANFDADGRQRAALRRAEPRSVAPT